VWFDSGDLVMHKKETQEEFEDTKDASVNRRTDYTMTKRKRKKKQKKTTIYKTLHRKLKIEQHEPN
jgi:Zn-finger nucleic acid-binding protein